MSEEATNEDRALVVEAKDAPFKVQEIELGEPGRGEVLGRIAAPGVCHTDAITRAGDIAMGMPSRPLLVPSLVSFRPHIQCRPTGGIR